MRWRQATWLKDDNKGVTPAANLRFSKEFSELRTVMRGGYFSVVKNVSLKRSLGCAIPQIETSDCPLSWSQGEKEHFVWQCRLFADVPKTTFDYWIDKGSQHIESFCVNYIRRRAEKYIAARKHADRVLKELNLAGFNIYEQDITKVSGLLDGRRSRLIATDPPYAYNALGLYEALGRFSCEALDEHGWLITKCGQRWIREAMNAITTGGGEKLKYCHAIAEHTPGAQSAQSWIGDRNSVNIEWKPILVYSFGEPANWPGGFRDFIVSPKNEKELFKWQQGLPSTKEIVGLFSQPGDLVVDPFLGSGTTGHAAFELDRAFEGFDVNPERVIDCNNRIASALKARAKSREQKEFVL